ncbi:VirD4-like conjugal transfer protein, CD1115 family [Bacillus mesophilum]|uniref:TraM recognition domain-containing protein n=1 Tax=Bacillus mesophilum TaxID=1071718 RepID=A0A7V7UT36_9BACI|nr:type IV secretory system conjugative DNA transfer family protein [Bacillus mesophilum]KAB2329457.1 TraM recognition domain-containing protein [Bacillus mesophilum]
MKKNFGVIIFYLFAGFVILPVISYHLIGILERDFTLMSIQDSLSLDYFKELFTSAGLYKTYFSLNPINVACWGLIAYAFFMFFLSKIGPTEKDEFELSDEYKSHGTARWQYKKEAKKNYYEGPRQGWFLGSVDKEPFRLTEEVAAHAVENEAKLNMQVNAVGPPGSNKTTGFVYPALFYIPFAYKNSSEKPDIICTDPKGEILAYTGNYLKERNYDVKIIDFLHLKYGDTVNPLHYIKEEEDIMKIATGFVEAAGMKDAKSQNADPIWELGEGLLLSALISFVIEVFPKERHTFEEVGKLLASPNIRDFEAAETLFIRHNVTGYGEELWNKFLNLEDKLRSGVVGSLSIKMALFSLTRIKKITGSNSFNFEEIGRKKDKPLAIFIQMPDEDRTYSPIINTIISMMIKTMYSTARESHSKLPNPVYMILEEIANIGRLPGIEEQLGTMRGRRIYPMMIWQDLNQMRKMFGEAWEGIVAKCDTQVYLGVNDQFTAKYISEKLGKTTIKIQGSSEKGGGIMSSEGTTHSESKTQRPLLYPDEVERYDNERTIVIQRSRQPVTFFKTQYKFWEDAHRIVEPLELHELPLMDRLFENKVKLETEEKEALKLDKEELVAGMAAVAAVKEVAAADESFEPSTIEPLDDKLADEEVLYQNIDFETGEILDDVMENEFIDMNLNDASLVEPIEIDEEDVFDFESNIDFETEIQLPDSEIK